MVHLPRRLLSPILLTLLLAACSGGETPPAASEAMAVAPVAAEAGNLSGEVSLDGSSTVYPISEAVAEEFQATAPDVRVTVGVSGTGGGFKRFLATETDINDASRPISESEIADAATKGLTVAELKMIWQPGSTVDSWNDIRAEWPDQPIRLYGAGTDSGTFDYFTEVINGEAGASRPDYTSSEDDNVLVQGIEGDENAMGYFGYAYYFENMDKLKLVPIDSGNGPVAPNPTTINDGTYNPLSRPLYIYLSKTGAAKPQVRAFVEFYLEIAPQIVSEVGYIALPAADYETGKAALAGF